MKITLIDDNFSHHTYHPEKLGSSLASFPGYDRYPTSFQWDRDRNNIHDVCVFTDGCLDLATDAKFDGKKKILWLLEPREIIPEIYRKAVIYHKQFDVVLTHDEKLSKEIPNYQYYVFGGAWIKDEDFNIYPKTKKISIVASSKRQTAGHRLRHEIIEKFSKKYEIDVYGRGYRPLDYLLEAYKDYEYTIVVENVREGIITEKLLTPLLCGTQVLYWGTPTVKTIFNKIMTFDGIDDLDPLLFTVCKCEFNEEVIKENIEYNFNKAKKFVISEENLILDYDPKLYRNQK